MPAILNRLPIPASDGLVFVGAEQVRLRADQIVVWVGLDVRDTLTANLQLPRFPALLDTGMNHYFALQERHLTEWAGVAFAQLDVVGRVRERGQVLWLRAASLFAFANIPGTSELSQQIPVRLAMPRGIVVYPNAGFPRLPILGLRTILHNRLRLTISGDNRSATLRTRPLFWPLF
jgi:hypothetical protein